jgi:hypothetical protein
MADKANKTGIQFEDAGDIIRQYAEQKGQDEGTASWPKRCATSQICFLNSKGRLVKSDLFISVEVDEHGEFNPEANNPVAIHNAPGGVPQHEYGLLRVKDQRGQTRPWVTKAMSAMTAMVFDHHVPATETPAEEAKAGLASPAVDMPM